MHDDTFRDPPVLYTALSDKLAERTQAVADLYMRTVQVKLCELVAARLGRAPTNAEIEKHGACRHEWPEPGWRTFTWDDDILFAVTASFEGVRFVVKYKQPRAA